MYAENPKKTTIHHRPKKRGVVYSAENPKKTTIHHRPKKTTIHHASAKKILALKCRRTDLWCIVEISFFQLKRKTPYTPYTKKRRKNCQKCVCFFIGLAGWSVRAKERAEGQPRARAVCGGRDPDGSRKRGRPPTGRKVPHGVRASARKQRHTRSEAAGRSPPAER